MADDNRDRKAAFGFDDRYTMFDVTPVENQLIQELLPLAKGDYVKVYLYGLMFCYHPENELTLEQMSRELDLPQEEIEKAYRYWERHGAVRRISDCPPAWRYVNLKQKSLTTEEAADPEYEAFSMALYDVFDHGRRLHGSEIQACYEWVEDLHLPTEVVIMLLRHMAAVKGKQFTIQSAGKVAAEMAGEGVETLEDAEAFLSRDRQMYDGTKRVLRMMGKRGLPSEAQVAMYRKWVRDWHFTPEAIEAACDETAKGDPSMGYLDGILRNLSERTKRDGPILPRQVDAVQQQRERLKKLLDILGRGTVNAGTLTLLQEIEGMYPPDIIRIGAEECARNGKTLADLKKLLESWQDRGLGTRQAVEDYVSEFHRQNDLLRQLREKWNAGEPRIGDTSRRMVARWEQEYGFSRELILKAAEYAYEAKAPMAYLDKLLSTFRDQGITTAEAMEQAREKPGTPGREDRKAASVPAQQYQQRDYNEPKETPEEMIARLTGGDVDA